MAANYSVEVRAEGGKPVPPIRRLIQWATRNCRHTKLQTLVLLARNSGFARHCGKAGMRRTDHAAALDAPVTGPQKKEDAPLVVTAMENHVLGRTGAD